MIKRQALFAILAVGTVLAACAGGGGGGVTPSTGGAGKMGNAQFSIIVPATVNMGTRAKPHFISPNTQSISIAVNGHAPVISNLTPTSPNCTQSSSGLTCMINVTAPIAADTFVLKLYDNINATGNVLAASTVSKTIATNTSITVEMNGVIGTLTVYLSNPSPIIGQSAQIQVGVTAMDASGAIIMGPGNFTDPVTLTSDDHSGHTALSGTSIAGPSSTLTLTYDGSSSVTAVTISATSPGVSHVTPGVLRPSNAQNGGGGVGVVNIGTDTYAELPSKAGLIQVKLTNNGTLATTPPSPGPSPSPRGTLLAISGGVDGCTIATVSNKINAFCANALAVDTPIDIIDLTSGTPAATGSFATDASQEEFFSGGACFVCGISWDPADSALLLSTGNNPVAPVQGQTWPGAFEFYKTDGTQARGTIYVNQLAENFGYNSVSNQIFNFGYAEADLIDVASATVYKSLDPIFTNPQDQEGFPGPAIDATAVDPSTNIGVSTDEYDGLEYFAPMNSAIFSSSVPSVRRRHGVAVGGATFTNPIANVLPLTNDAESAPGSSCEPTAITIDGTSHLAFLSGEFSAPNCVAAIQLPSTSPTNPVVPTTYMIVPVMPNTPDGQVFDSAYDPHVAATFYLQGNDVYGLVFNSFRSWVAVVDLTKLLAAPGTELDPHLVDPGYDLIANGVITYLPTGFAPGPASNIRHAKQLSRRHR